MSPENSATATHGPDLSGLDDVKRALRKAAQARRAALAGTGPASTRAAGEAIAARFLGRIDLTGVAAVSAFWPFGDEIDTRPLMTALHERGLNVLLPVVQGRGRPLLFGLWAPGDRLVPAGFGTQEPAPERPRLTPDLLCVPLLAFDRAGYRLGYGGGFYDRTLEALRAGGRDPSPRAVGIAFAGQEVEQVPHGPHDQALDAIVTEAETIDLRRRTG